MQICTMYIVCGEEYCIVIAVLHDRMMGYIPHSERVYTLHFVLGFGQDFLVGVGEMMHVEQWACSPRKLSLRLLLEITY